MKKAFQDSINMSIKYFWYSIISSAIFGIFINPDTNQIVEKMYIKDGLYALLGLFGVLAPLIIFTISIVYSFLIGIRLNKRYFNYLDNSSAKIISLENLKENIIHAPHKIGVLVIIIFWMILFHVYAQILFQYVPYFNEIGINSVIWISILIAIYFSPIMVATDRKHTNIVAISIFNLLLGWTIIGWIFALIWATTLKINKSTKYQD